MKKKSAIIALLLAGMMSFGVVGTAACNKRDGGHKHTWSEYKQDGAEGHHRTTTCEGHDPIDEKISAHDAGDICGKCGYDSRPGTVHVSSVKISGDNSVKVGGKITLSAAVTPENATNSTVVWEITEGKTFAEIDQSGLLTGKAAGTVTVKATADGKSSELFTVTVAEQPVVKDTYTVKFMDGSTVVETKSVEKGQTVSAPTLTSNDGKYFGGWYDNAACTGNAYDFSTPISGTKTFYANWIELDANITYSYAGEEAVAFEWNDTNASKARVAYKLSSETSYTNVDDALIRGVDADTVRVDILGLKGNASYDFKITTSAGADMEVNQMPISAYDRSGYAHFNYTDGVGAYNDDGTLKANAIVLYVTDETKNTVSLTYGGTTVTGIGNILNSVGQDVGGGKTSNGGTANSNQGIIKKLGEANVPLVVRFIGCVSDSGLYKAAKF
ncbi:MAG: Ig-like domain-containing protein, partial [Clostridia bacterium]|nr:Ig-like domain-containing protein [Clostridia bacterium]